MSRESDVSTASRPEVRQLALGGFGQASILADCRARRRESNHRAASHAEDPLVRSYQRRLAARGAAPKGMAAYCYQLRVVRRTAARFEGHEVDVCDLFGDESLLGQVLVDDVSDCPDTRLSKWTLAQRRSAVRSFATLMRPELLDRLGEDPHRVLDRALRSAADRVGGGYRLTGGAPRRRGGQAPTPDEIAAVIAEAGREPGFFGARNRAFFGLLAATGTRLNALRHLDGSDCVVVPSGRLRVFLHEKGKAERREVELSRVQSDAIRAYADEFNQYANGRHWQARIELGAPMPVWRNSGRGRWTEHDVRAALRTACISAGVSEFTPHALRRAFATDAASRLPRHVVALAGGWKGLERLDDHYVQPRPQTIWEKLHGGGPPAEDDPVGSAVSTAAPAL